MFENEWFPYANAMGVTWEAFWGMNPHIIKVIYGGYKERQKVRDREMWSWFGSYGISAMVFAIDHCFSKMPKTNYLENPVMEKISEEPTKALTEEERIQAERNRQYMILKVMQTNFELNKELRASKDGTGS